MWLWRRAPAHWKSGPHDSSRVQTPQCQKHSNKPTTGPPTRSSERARTAARGLKCRSHKGTVKETVGFGAAVQNGFPRPGTRRPAWRPPGEAKVDYSSTLCIHWAVLAHDSSTLGTLRPSNYPPEVTPDPHQVCDSCQ